MGLKWLRAFFSPATCVALLLLLFAAGSVRTIAAQAGAAVKPPEQDSTKKETEEAPTSPVFYTGNHDGHNSGDRVRLWPAIRV